MTRNAPLPLVFGEDGLVPAVITDSTSGDVLMVGFMNEEALVATRDTGFVHFWSRSRGRLWKKGESSGHVQAVQEIRVNCDCNSLLIEVVQTGAVCHDGYPTCYYRRLQPDNSLTIVRDRWFDPADVYGDGEGIATATRLWWGAYAWLREQPLEEESGTSRRLRAAADTIAPRVADELRELAGVLDGSHRHEDLTSDVALEGGQVCYWVALACTRADLAWEDVRPDRALDQAVEETSIPALTALLRAEAGRWDGGSPLLDLAAAAHNVLALVAGTCAIAGVEPLELIRQDLDNLRSRPYLTPYFDSYEPAAAQDR